jgi:hypothetical protein
MDQIKLHESEEKWRIDKVVNAFKVIAGVDLGHMSQ